MDEQQVGSLREALRSVSGISFNAAEGGRSGDNMNLRGFYTFGDLYLDESEPGLRPGACGVFDGWMAHASNWDDVVWLRQRIGDRALILKGVLHGDDADRAIAAGCDGSLVSNHGHRVLSRAIRLLRDELEMTMALAGCARIADITTDRIDRDPDRMG